MFRPGDDITGFPLRQPVKVFDEPAGGKGLGAPCRAAGPYPLSRAGIARKGSSPPYSCYSESLSGSDSDDPSILLKSAAFPKAGREEHQVARPQGRVVAEEWFRSSIHSSPCRRAEKQVCMGSVIPESGPWDFDLLRLPANKANLMHCLDVRLSQAAVVLVPRKCVLTCSL